MRAVAACLLLLLTVAPARAQDDPDAVARAALEAGERLLAEGKLREARKEFDAAKANLGKCSPAVKDDVYVGRLRFLVAVAARYAAGEELKLYTGAELGVPEVTPRKAAAKIYESVLRGLHEVADPAVRARVLADPALASLDDVPAMRVLRWSQWRTPRLEVWPDAKELDTGDALFDPIFARLGTATPPEEGYEIEPFHDWLEAHEADHTTPGSVWAFRYRCSLANPVNQGGWPMRMGILSSARSCKAAIAELTPKGDEAPKGFGAAVLVNLHIAAGERARALELLRGLRASGPRFLYDSTLHNAQQLAAKFYVANKTDAELTAFSDELDEWTFGLPERAAPAKAGGDKPAKTGGDKPKR